jgi:DNA polymerase III epsilon subunit-like protein
MHIMLDLETLGTTPGCAIVSIGACAFSMDGLGEEFYTVVDIEKNVGDLSPSTVKWWMGQSDEARAVFSTQGVHIAEALSSFAAFWKRCDGEFLWGHGAGFDAPILEAAYVVLGYQAPFKFFNSRDTRTLYALADTYPKRSTGTRHNALDDAKAQADAVIVAYKKLNKTL